MARYIPKEHGGWSMLGVSFVVGAAVGTTWNGTLLSLGILIGAGYSVRLPLLAWFQRKRRDAIPWCVGYGMAGVLALIPLLRHPQRGMLAVGFALSGVLFLAGLWFASRHRQRSVLAEFIGVVGLTLPASIAYYGAFGDSIQMAGLLWLLNALFFGSSIFYVKMRFEEQLAARRSDPQHSNPFRRYNIAYHAALSGLLALLWFAGVLPWLAVVAFSPLLIRGWDRWRGTSSTIRQLGFRELGMSLGYALLLILAL